VTPSGRARPVEGTADLAGEGYWRLGSVAAQRGPSGRADTDCQDGLTTDEREELLRLRRQEPDAGPWGAKKPRHCEGEIYLITYKPGGPGRGPRASFQSNSSSTAFASNGQPPHRPGTPSWP
jgi:hypothetical protein